MDRVLLGRRHLPACERVRVPLPRIRGPTVVDRLLAVNIVGTKTLVVLVVLALVFGRAILLDVALVYGLLNFVVTVAASRYLETGRLQGD